MMTAMNKDHYITAQMMIIAGLLEHTKNNRDGSIFEDEKTLEGLLETLHQGFKIASLRMQNIMKEAEDDERYDCCH